MSETNIYPDFIVIDGGEGGTGAGPIEFVDHMGSPLIDGLIFAQNVLVGSGVRDKLKLAASAKITSASKMALPISTTHTLVGAVLGVGLARGIGALNLTIVRDIALSWVITIPAGAILAIVFYKTLGLVF